MTKTICLDFDGVLNTYAGWQGEDELFAPRPGLFNFLQEISRCFDDIKIYSTRPPDKIWEWLISYGLTDFFQKENICQTKPPAIVYVDDRGLKFEGDYAQTLQQVQDFKTYWE